MIKKQVIRTEKAPPAVGPYSQAVRVGDWLFVSGQIGLDPGTGQLVGGGIEAETERVLENLKAVLEAAGSSLARVVKTTVYLREMSDFPAMNQVYARYFGVEPPARSTVQALPPRGARVEIEAVALTTN